MPPDYVAGGHGAGTTTSTVNSVTQDGVTVTYTYDATGGNITSRDEYAYTTGDVSGEPTSHKTYGYGNASWKDLLTSYNGQTITSDKLGNPLNYRDGIKLTWKNGRQLASSTVGNIVTTYNYDISGNRVYRAGGGFRHTYYVVDGVAMGEKIVIVSSGATHYMEYMRDENGDVYGFIYDGSTYFLEKNALGDVQYLLDGSGNVLAQYSYDEWGKVVSVVDVNGNDITSVTDVAHLNPFRYRSYYYDEETGFYYLNSRYYDPQTSRFVNMDNVTDGNAGVIGYNLFIYAANNPINNSDPTGNGIIKSAIKWVAKNIVKPVVKAVKNALSKTNATYSTGINVSGTPSAFSFNAQYGISVDTKGNVAIQKTLAGGISTGSPGISLTSYKTVSNAPSIYKLNGQGYQVGGSTGINVEGIPLAAGAEMNFIPDEKENKVYVGGTVSRGVGTPGAEFHVEWGETSTEEWSEFNVFDEAQYIYVKIMEW